jgi:acyl-coenzyme A synthetase/AMP-(fatty) acid ligase
MGGSGIEEISVAIVANRQVADSHLIDWCGERGIPLTRIFFVDTLPKTSSGKIHRDLLKRQLLDSNAAT